MVPENILWAFFSAFDYQQKYDVALNTATPLPKDIYYKNTKGEWVKVTAVFDCIDNARRNYRLTDAKYLGPVLADTKGEIERGAKYPPAADKTASEAQRKEDIKKRLAKKKSIRVPGDPGTITVKDTSKVNEIFWAKKYYYDEDFKF